MSDKIAENLGHLYHAVEHTDAGRHAIHAGGMAVAASLVAAPVLVPIAVAAGSVALLGYGLCALFGKK